MHKRFSIADNLMLSGIVDQIDGTLECPKFKKFSNQIEIDTWGNIYRQISHHKGVAENGYGFCITNFFELGEFKRIIVINQSNCLKSDFTNREIGAIVLHELGHLLNNPELDYEPTLLDHFKYGVEYHYENAKKIREQNLLKMELYADSYATQFGYGNDLLSTFDKQNLNFEQKIGFFEERVNGIKENKILVGSVAAIEKKGL